MNTYVMKKNLQNIAMFIFFIDFFNWIGLDNYGSECGTLFDCLFMLSRIYHQFRVASSLVLHFANCGIQVCTTFIQLNSKSVKKPAELKTSRFL